MKTRPHPRQHIERIEETVRRYFEARLRQEAIVTLNETIRGLRILLQEVLTDHFLPLPIGQAREFRSALTDRLHNICESLGCGCAPEDDHHHRYCVQEVIACFEWAEQIKEEVPDDPVTQKILAVDIPILRPFDYGLSKVRPVKRR